VKGSLLYGACHRRPACRGAVRSVGVSTRRSSGLTTRGVRADRVGVAPAPGRPQGRTQERAPSPVPPRLCRGASRAMARVGCASASSGPWPVSLGWRLPARRCGASASDRGATAALPVLGAGTSSGVASAAHDTTLGGEGTRERKLLRARADAGERGERSARAHAGLGLACGAGIGRSCGRARGSGWLQKSTSGARSRPKGLGLAPWLPAPVGELRWRRGAGSRVAAAKAASTRAATPVAGSS
jgi:hypothetical protein